MRWATSMSTIRHSELFEALEPPRGGLARLRRALDRRHGLSRPRAWRIAAATAGALSLGIALWTIIGERSPVAGRLAGESADYRSQPTATPVATVDPARRQSMALREVPTGDPNVRFYWVASRAEPDAEG